MSDNKFYFKNLDSIRFIAAMMVFFGHGLGLSYQYLPIKGTFLEKLIYAVSNGGTGVSIFFVLSGFLITFLLLEEHEINKKISIKNFYIRRTLRIWPLYFAVVTFSFLVYPFLKSLIGIHSHLGSNFIYHLTFLSNFDVINIQKYFAGLDASSQNITWSVSVEEQFYLFWPLIFVFLPKRLWLISMIMVVGGSLVFRFIYYNDSIVLYFHTFAVLLDLGIGGLFAYFIKENVAFRTYFEKTSTWTHLSFFIITFCLLLWGENLFPFKYTDSFLRLLISFCFGLIITAQAITKSNSALNLSNMSFASKWGKYTYGIYLLHPIALTIVDILFRYAGFLRTNFINSFLYGIIGLILTMIISRLSYDYFESRFIILKNKFYQPSVQAKV